LPPPVAGRGAVVVGGRDAGAFVAGGLVGAAVGGLAVGAVVGVARPPPAQDTPLIVQLVGTPLPATMKPNVVLAPAATEAL
jgi:hypothetical protein